MSIISKETIVKDIELLHSQQIANYSDISIAEVADLSIKLKTYKKTFGKDKLYSEYKKEVKNARDSKLHFRVSDSVKKCIKEHQRIPQLVRNIIPIEVLRNCSAKGQEMETGLRKLEEWLVEHIAPTSLAVALAQKINWAHGTNSAALSLLKELDFTFLPTGEMLQQGIAPMCGEISSGGMFTDGINQRMISAVPIDQIKLAWNDYACEAKYHFPVAEYVDISPKFSTVLDLLMKTSPDDHQWDELIVSLLRAKQWAPEAFEDLCIKHKVQIEGLKQKSIQTCSYRECAVLRALDWDLEDLKLACNNDEKILSIERELGLISTQSSIKSRFNWHSDDSMNRTVTSACSPYFLRNFEENWKVIVSGILGARLYGKFKGRSDFETEANKRFDQMNEQRLRNMMQTRIQKNMIPFKKRHERLLQLFDSSKQAKLSPSDFEMITSPFPILVASSKTKATSNPNGKEINIRRAQLGKDIDVIFVRPENLHQINIWLKQNHLDNTVTAYSSELIEQIGALPILSGPKQVVGNMPYLSIEAQEKLSVVLEQKVFPLYRTLYPNGLKRECHGVMHVLRAAVLAQVLAEFYRNETQPLKTKLENLMYATTLHDLERENDGVDKWDAKSGKRCEKILIELGVDELIAALFKDAITDKESSHPNSLEHKILHDADCLEIIRFFINLDKFEFENLWIYKEFGQEKTIDLIKEAGEFIILTENAVIKNYIENHERPYPAIIRVLNFVHNMSGQFPHMTEYLSSALEAFAEQPSDVQSLPKDICDCLMKLQSTNKEEPTKLNS